MGQVRSIVASAIAGSLAGLVAVAGWLYLSPGADSAGETAAKDQDVVADASTRDAAQPPPFRQSTMKLPPQPAGFEPFTTDPREEAANALATAKRTESELSSKWNADTEDPIKGTETEQRLFAAAESEAVLQSRYQPERLTMGCRSSMCRVDTTFAPGADGAEWATRMLLAAGGTFGASSIVTLPSAGGGYRVVIYAFRPGMGPH